MQLKILVRPAQRGRLVSVSKLYFEIKVISKLTVASGGFGGGGTSAFGAKPAFGAFGGGGNTSTFGSGGTGAFGQTNAAQPSTNAFGQPSNTGATFGGGLFGGQKPATAPTVFGGAPSTGGAAGATDGVVPPVTTGTSNPPYSVHTEKDTTGASAVTLHYQSITMMPAYRGTSFEVCVF